jgi:hypothetical protein
MIQHSINIFIITNVTSGLSGYRIYYYSPLHPPPHPTTGPLGGHRLMPLGGENMKKERRQNAKEKGGKEKM